MAISFQLSRWKLFANALSTLTDHSPQRSLAVSGQYRCGVGHE
jgi:hypothetical protein